MLSSRNIVKPIDFGRKRAGMAKLYSEVGKDLTLAARFRGNLTDGIRYH